MRNIHVLDNFKHVIKLLILAVVPNYVDNID